MVRAVSVLRFATLALVVCTLACGDLRDFGGVYQGSIVEGSFVRSCFPDKARALLRFDPELAVAGDAGAGALPNTLTVTQPEGEPFFQDTVLEPITGLQSDQLSRLDFPGPQRLRSYVLLARPLAGPLAGRDAFVVVSLLASEDIELRIVARTADASGACPATVEDPATVAPDAAREYFGFFRLTRTGRL